MTIQEVAKIYKKDPNWVRAGIIEGWLPIWKATRNGKLVTDISEMDIRKGRINYYIDPNLVTENKTSSILFADILKVTEKIF